MKIGFIGTGVMGRGIINNLLKANYDVVVYNRTKAHAQSVLDNGATWADGPKAIAEAADLVITMLVTLRMLKNNTTVTTDYLLVHMLVKFSLI